MATLGSLALECRKVDVVYARAAEALDQVHLEAGGLVSGAAKQRSWAAKKPYLSLVERSRRYLCRLLGASIAQRHILVPGKVGTSDTVENARSSWLR